MRYTRKLKEVEAIQAKPGNIEELRKFIGRKKIIAAQSSNSPCYIVCGLYDVLNFGDWLLRDSAGKLEIMSNIDFNRDYEQK